MVDHHPLLPPPHVEGTVRLPDRRRLGFAEFGAPDGLPVLWFHGTPGSRHQIPPHTRQLANEHGVRLIGLERPGIGESTPHAYDAIVDWARDVEVAADHLGLDRFAVIGLSGGGPYVLACAHEMPDRVVSGTVLGGVAPSVGDEAAPGGVVALTARFQALLDALNAPLGMALWGFARAVVPFREQAFGLYMRVSPEGDQRVFARPEMKAMFLDDLTRGTRRQVRSVAYDARLFGRHWGFALRDITVPIRFYQGDSDHIVPLSHGEHQAGLVKDSSLTIRPGESHLGSLDAADEILTDIVERFGSSRRVRSKARPSVKSVP